MKKYLWGIIYTIVLFGFTVYILLDAFIITRIYTVVPQEESSRSVVSHFPGEDDTASTAQSSGTGNEAEKPRGKGPSPRKENRSSSHEPISSSQSTADLSLPETLTYKDENISITLTSHRYLETWVYVADIYVSSPEYLKTAFAQNAYGRNITEKTSKIAQTQNAILAINGDYYGARQRGYVLRNGQLYRDIVSSRQEDLVIWQDGHFSIIREDEISADELLSRGATQILSFGPALVTEGAVAITQDEEVGKAMASNPRTAIGILEDLHYVFVVSDGRTTESAGLSLYQLAQFMEALGVSTAYNLDGGGSSTMVFQRQVVNQPTTNGKNIKERSVSDIVYIG